MEDKKFILNFELVPDSCWYSNLRSLLSKAQWEFIKKDARERANGKCMICGRKTTRLETHEQWMYDETTNTQILSDIKAICPDCHRVIHFGFTSLRFDNTERYENHFMKVNNCTYADFKEQLNKANIDHQRRNQINEWKLDLQYLTRYILD